MTRLPPQPDDNLDQAASILESEVPGCLQRTAGGIERQPGQIPPRPRPAGPACEAQSPFTVRLQQVFRVAR